MAHRRKPECDNLSPLWRRSLLESEMRSPTTRFEMALVIAFLIAAVALLVYPASSANTEALPAPSHGK